MAITLKRTSFRKALPLINSTCHNSTNNCVAYLVDICDILPLFCYKISHNSPLFCDKLLYVIMYN